MKLLLLNLNKFQKGEQALQQILFYLHIVQTKETKRESSILLKGYIALHSETCPMDNCPLRKYLEKSSIYFRP